MAVASRKTGKYDTGEPVFLDPPKVGFDQPMGILFFMDHVVDHVDTKVTIPSNPNIYLV